MSTRFYGYRVPRDRFWDLVDEVRAYYYDNSTLMELAREAYAKAQAINRRQYLSDQEKVEKQMKLYELFDGEATEQLTVQLQVFEEPDSDNYVFRVLERGFAFGNAVEKEGWSVEPFYYDNGSDVSDEEAARRPLVNYFDDCIHVRRYFIVPIIEVEDARLHLHRVDTSPEGRLKRVSEAWPKVGA